MEGDERELGFVPGAHLNLVPGGVTMGRVFAIPNGSSAMDRALSGGIVRGYTRCPCVNGRRADSDCPICRGGGEAPICPKCEGVGCPNCKNRGVIPIPLREYMGNL